MDLNITLIKMARFKAIILLTLIIFLLDSCSIKKMENFQVENNKELITTRKFIISNHNFKKLILSSKERFKKRYKKEPNSITISLLKKDNQFIVEIINSEYLYNNKEEKDFMNESFFAGMLIDNTLILIKNSGDYYLEKGLINIENESTSFKIYYGNSINSCLQTFKILDNNYVLINNSCASDIYTE